jgi:hypothetical protein
MLEKLTGVESKVDILLIVVMELHSICHAMSVKSKYEEICELAYGQEDTAPYWEPRSPRFHSMFDRQAPCCYNQKMRCLGERISNLTT